MEEIQIVVVDSASVYIEKLNHRLHHELECTHHYHAVSQLANGLQRSLHLFRGIVNPAVLPLFLRSYETLESTQLYFGTVRSIRKYYIHGKQGAEGRLKVEAANRHLYDIAIDALDILEMNGHTA